jgi:hypothetical protein
MSNTTTFAVGLGSGLALWHLTNREHTSSLSSPSTTSPSAQPTAPALRTCIVRIEPTALTVDGARVDLAEAIRSCKAAGHAAVSVAPNAPASLYARLIAALGAANIPTTRNGRSRPRESSRASERYTHEGRTILRDGEPILYVDRVDLGDARYAISPYHADLLTGRMVRLLNKHGAR